MSDSIAISILLAAFLDTLIVTGYLTYGGAIAAAATVGFTAGMTHTEVFALSTIGIVLSEFINITFTRYSGIARRVRPVLDRLAERENWFSRLVARLIHRHDDGIFVRFLKLLGLRFFAATRPINTALLATQGPLHFVDYLSIIIVSTIWVGFWVIFFGNLLEFVNS